MVEVEPGVRGSFSVSLLCAEPIGEPDMVGERTVGDLGVAAPEKKNETHIERLPFEVKSERMVIDHERDSRDMPGNRIRASGRSTK